MRRRFKTKRKRCGFVKNKILNIINLFAVKIKRSFDYLFISFIYLDVWKMLDKSKFDKFSSILTKQPNIINSLRDDLFEDTLMIYAARNRRNDCFKFLLKKPHDVSVVDEFGYNVLHRIVGWNNDDAAIE